MSDDDREPVDPDFARLFRDEEPAAPEPSPPSLVSTPYVPADPAPIAWEEPEEEELDEPEALTPEAQSPAPVVTPSDPVADTGRLFRSQGVADHPDTVLAVPADKAGRLRTLDRIEPTPTAPAASAVASDEIEVVGHSPAVQDADDDAVPLVERTSMEPVVAAAAAIPGSLPVGVMPNDAASYPPDPSNEEVPLTARRVRSPRSTGSHRARAISAGAGYIIVIGVTLIVGFINAVLASGDIGWPTGLALLVSSAYVALTIRPDDASVAVIVPPVAFGLTALTAGQLFLGSSASGLLNRAVVWFFDLADSWIWIIGSTLVALVIVIVRRRLDRR
jgi:hypothetical protein